MVKHIWSVLCRTSIIDVDTNNVTLQETYEELLIEASTEGQTIGGADHTIALPFPFEVTSLFYRESSSEDEDFTVVTTFTSPQGKPLFTKEDQVKIRAGQKRARTRLKSMTIPLTTTGTYILKVELKQVGNKTTYSEIPLDIKLRLTEK
jgi:hypothetical protein